MPEGKTMPGAERLLPAHVGGIVAKEQKILNRRPHLSWRATGGGVEKWRERKTEAAAARSEALRSAPDFEKILQDYLRKQGKEPPENRNLSLIAIKEFQRHAREAQDLRKVARTAQDPVEKAYASILFGRKKAKIDEYLAFGLPFEKAYREYIRSRNDFIQFDSTLEHILELEDFLNKPAFSSQLPEDKRDELDERAYARLESIIKNTDISTLLNHGQEIETLLEGLKLIHPEDSPEYQETKEKLLAIKLKELPKSKKEVLEELGRQKQKAQQLWQDPMVRYFWQQKDLDRLSESFAKGEDVIETQDVIKNLNLLHEWETQHQRTTIGGVLVGPPGVGKTTLIRHYLEAKGRNYVYIDLSEDVTRYLLYGSKSLEFKSPAEAHENLMQRLQNLDGELFKRLISENSAILKRTFGLNDDESVVTAIAQIEESLKRSESNAPEIKTCLLNRFGITDNGRDIYKFLNRALNSFNSDESSDKKLVVQIADALKGVYEADGQLDKNFIIKLFSLVNEAKLAESQSDKNKEVNERVALVIERIKDFAGQYYRRELAQEFYYLVRKNGWRDGVVISALRRGDSIIFDEFNKNKNWSLLFGLMTAKPGEDWYFADNDEYIKIPDNWRMYFTANIGRKHGGFEVAEALASRAGGKVMEINYPSPRTEMQVAIVTLSDAEEELLRSNEDLSKLYVLIYEAFPKIRLFIEGQRQVIPISFRTIRDLAEKLVLQRDPKSGIPVYQATDKSFDEAVYEVLVGSYALYEDKTAPREIVNLLTSVGILLDDNIKEKIVPAWMDQETYEERQKTFAENKEDFADIVKKIRGIQTQSLEAEFPVQRNF